MRKHALRDQIGVEHDRYDIVVVGGGLAGVCAAIAAARAGLRVVLVHNRTVLGGNSSSEIRVWVCGATSHGEHHYARETGIMGELFVENQYRNRDGNPYYWDQLLLEKVLAEPGIRLLLGTHVDEVEVEDGDHGRKIVAVGAVMAGSERVFRLEAEQFVDASGDGTVGFLAGARYRTGRESHAEYGEKLAPVEPDDETLGSTILFYVKDAGHPVRYVAPPWAVDIASTSVPTTRYISPAANGCAYWWIELGGDRDVVHDDDQLRLELQGAALGVWDYIKNSGRFDADNLTLEWVGSVPGRREYRRFVGDHTLTEQDILTQAQHDDTVAFGGWSLDLHPPGGIYAKGPGSRHVYSDGTYDIPLRVLYARDLANLWVAGRDISASHVAFGSTRVMATCAILGEAVGIAASVAARNGCRPQQVATTHLTELRRALVRADASVQGIGHDDPEDLALQARVTASSTRTQLTVPPEPAAEPLALDRSIGIVLPVDPALEEIRLLVEADEPTTVYARLHATSHPRNYLPGAKVATASVDVSSAGPTWITLPLVWRPAEPANAFLVLDANPHLRLARAANPVPGVTTLVLRDLPPEPLDNPREWRAWKRLAHRDLPVLDAGPTAAWSPGRAVGGFARPWGGPQLWASAPLDLDPHPTLTLRWDHTVTFSEVAVVFDDDVEEDLINLHHHTTPFDVIPELVRDYRVEALLADTWTTAAHVTGNRRRHVRHRLEAPTRADAVRVVVLATNGAPCAHLSGLRVWR